jgi:hypothetical protein
LELSSIDPSMLPSKNLYDYIIERGFNSFMGKGSGITSLRTGYDPAKLRLKYEQMRREVRVKEAR